jgi:hypothetical protein
MNVDKLTPMQPDGLQLGHPVSGLTCKYQQQALAWRLASNINKPGPIDYDFSKGVSTQQCVHIVTLTHHI